MGKLVSSLGVINFYWEGISRMMFVADLNSNLACRVLA